MGVRKFATLAVAMFVVAAGAPSAQTTPSIKFTDTKLANGLRVIIAEDHHAPVYSIVVHYKVGSRDERKGRTGFAHLFEHMMFKGSENVGPGEHFMLVFTNGGSMNGTTNKDRTLYFETLPANQLDLGIFLEADRMRSLEITKDNLWIDGRSQRRLGRRRGVVLQDLLRAQQRRARDCRRRGYQSRAREDSQSVRTHLRAAGAAAG
jgi:hypothetical protein